MKDTLVVVHSHAAANDMVAILFPHYKTAGCDILGIGRTNSKCIWPEPIPTRDIGIDLFKTWVEHKSDSLPKKLIGTLEVCLSDFPQYNDYCIIEWDSIFVKPLPKHTGGLVSVPCMVDNRITPFQNMKSNIAFQCPWWFDKPTAEIAIRKGRELIEVGDIEEGTPDHFLGRIVQLSGIKYSPIATFFRMEFETPELIEEARQRYRSKDVFYIHGFKKISQLTSVTQ